MKFRKIYTVGAMSILVTVAMTGCPSVQPVDTSQSILIQTGEALADIDRSVASGARSRTDAAVERAARRVQAGECNEGEPPEVCSVRWYREEMELWYNLTTALEGARGTLDAWQQANDAWRQSGERPSNWNEVVCLPVSTMMETVTELLTQVGIDIPEGWRAIIVQSDEVCQLGMAIADMISGE